MRILIIIKAVLAIPVLSFSATINVPADYQKIQYAINAAVDGDTILVSPGVYVENIDYKYKGIIIQSTNGPSQTTIDGNHSDTVVKMRYNNYYNPVIDGFTLTNGWSYSAGGISAGSNSIILNSIITGNSVYSTSFSGGAGVECVGTMIINNVIYNNSAPNAASASGGGISCIGGGCTISNNTIYGNSATFGGGISFINESYQDNIVIYGNTIKENIARQGGGIMMTYISYLNDPIIIDNNIITNNEATDYLQFKGKGGGIYFHQMTSPGIELTNNILSGNTATQEGGGILSDEAYLVKASNNKIIGNSAGDGGGAFISYSYWEKAYNNIVACNTATNGGGYCFRYHASGNHTNNTVTGNSAVKGGGIYYRDCEILQPVFTNTILWNNSAQTGPEIWIGGTTSPNTTFNISYSDVQGGQTMVYVAPGCILNWGPGMIAADPFFADTNANDFHILYTSNCKDVGYNSAPGIPAEDFEGNPRIEYATVDMGADEFHRHVYYTGNATPGGSIALKVIGVPQNDVWLWFATILYDPPLSTEYGDWYLQNNFPVDGINLGIIPSNGLISNNYTIPTSPTTPYTLYMQAILLGIDDKLTGVGVLDVK